MYCTDDAIAREVAAYAAMLDVEDRRYNRQVTARMADDAVQELRYEPEWREPEFTIYNDGWEY